MRQVKKSSLLYMILPLLFEGCVQEKISTVTPLSGTKHNSEITDKNISLKINTTFNYTPPHIQEKYFLSKLTISHPVQLESITKEDNKKENSVLDEKSITTINTLNVNFLEKNRSISATTLTKTWQPLAKEDEIIETAKEFLGVKYIWAANGPNAFDCSGFTKYVFKAHGIPLPRYSGYQAQVGIEISYRELKKGDLVFFDTAKKHSKSKRKVNHVGIFLGNHEFIHASSAGKKVMISSFDQKPFYKKKFMHGQRILNTASKLALL